MNPVVARVILRLRLVVQRADLDAAGTEVGDQALVDRDLPATLTEREAIAADVGELAARERDLPGVFERDHPIHCADRGLVGGGRRERGKAFGVAETKPAEGEVCDGGAGLASDGQQLFRDGIGGARCPDGFAGAGQVGELA